MRARTALLAANETRATAAQQVMIHLHTALLQILASADFNQAFDTADGTRELIKNLTDGDRAAAECLIGRIQLAGAQYFHRTPYVAHSIRESMASSARVLEDCGLIDESLTARLTWADDPNQQAASIERLAQVAEWAQEQELWCGAGEIVLRRAERLLESGASLPDISRELETSRSLLDRGGGVSGVLDTYRLQARLEMERGSGSSEPMQACLNACLDASYKTGAVFALGALSQQAHEAGDIARATEFLVQELEVVGAAGLALVQDSLISSRVDLLVRAHRFREAIEFGRAAQAWTTRIGVANLHLQVATAYSLIGDKETAVREARQSLHTFESFGAVGFITPVRTFLASCLVSLGTEEGWNEGEHLLNQELDEDLGQVTSAGRLPQLEVLVQINVERFRFSPSRGGDPALLEEAEARLSMMEQTAALLVHRREAARRIGGCAQMRALIAAVRGEEEVFLKAQKSAAEHYVAGGLLMEAANARYLMGTQFLNRANRTDLSAEEREASATTAAGHFEAAIDYYRDTGQSVQVAGTLFMTARLFVNVAVARRQRMGFDPGDLQSAALDLLRQAEEVQDRIRRDFTPGDHPSDDQAGKQAVAESSRRIYELAVDLRLHGLRDNTDAWRWVQRAKARALVDAMSSGGVPSWVWRRVSRRPAAVQWLRTERDLTVRLRGASQEARLALRQELDAHWDVMPSVPVLREYRDMRQGTAWDEPEDPVPLPSDRRRIYADWFSLGDQIYLFVLRPGSAPEIFLVPLRVQQVREYVERNLCPEHFRLTLRDAPEILEEIAPLVEPLAWVSQPGDLLVLCPTGPLGGRLPLHALPLIGIPLLQRNPVVYAPSLTVLRNCLRRRRANEIAVAKGRIFGDPNEDRADASELVKYLGERYGAKTWTGGAVTRQRFLSALRQCSLIHFQGHAKHQPDKPLDSFLSFLKTGNDPLTARLTAREIALGEVRSGALVTLGACESAAHVNRAGDEPVGLIPALLQAGAGAVVASQWLVRQDAAAAFMRKFYDKLFSETGNVIDRAEAVRDAALAVREQWPEPYFWAAFTLHGDWRR